MTRIVVRGGGVAGLLAAGDLARAGHDVTLLESSPRLGGSLRAEPIAGRNGAVALDLGAESFATRGDVVPALVREIGLGDRLVAPRPVPAWVVAAGGAFPLPPAGALGIPGDAATPEVRAVLGAEGAAEIARDAGMPWSTPSADESIADLVLRRMGKRVLDLLVAPVARGVYSRGPEALTVGEALPGLVELAGVVSLADAVTRLRAAAPAGSAVLGLDGGVAQLAAALAERARAAGARLVVDASEPPAPGATVVDATSAGGPVTTTTVVALVFDDPALDAFPRGTGVLAAHPGVTARALTHSTAKWQWLAARLPAGRHVVRLSYDGAPFPDVTAAVAPALSDAAALLGVPLDPATVRDTRLAQWRQPVPGPVDDPLAIGARRHGTGLARVVAGTRAVLAEAGLVPLAGDDGPSQHPESG